MPLEISSRSESVSANLERCRGAGRIPPLGANRPKIEPEGLSNTRPIDLRDSPRCQRSHISAFCSAVYLIRVRYTIFQHSIFLHHDKVLRRPVESAVESGSWVSHCQSDQV